MPFDLTPTKPDVFSLSGLIAWLEGQDPTERFNFCFARTCLMTRYFASHGIAADDGDVVIYGGVEMYDDATRTTHPIARVALDTFTFGEALARARSLRDGGA